MKQMKKFLKANATLFFNLCFFVLGKKVAFAFKNFFICFICLLRKKISLFPTNLLRYGQTKYTLFHGYIGVDF